MVTYLGGILADLDVLAESLALEGQDCERRADELYMRMCAGEHGDEEARWAAAADYRGLRSRADVMRVVVSRLYGIAGHYRDLVRGTGSMGSSK